MLQRDRYGPHRLDAQHAGQPRDILDDAVLTRLGERDRSVALNHGGQTLADRGERLGVHVPRGAERDGAVVRAQGGEAHILNTASMAGLLPQPTAGAYVASKHAVVALSETLALELELFQAPVGVTVVCPGVVDTEILSSGRDTPSELRIAELHEQMGGTGDPVMGPRLAAPSEIALAVVDAIEANRLHVAPNGTPAAVRAQFDSVVADLEQP